MNALVPITLFGWPFVVLLLFAKLPKHRAVIVAFLVAWLFLPVVHDPVLGLRWTKMRATCCSVLFASLCMDLKHFISFRARLVDLPMLVWCISPFFSSLDNELGVYDGCSQSLDQFIAWGVPYLAGRLYLTSLDQLRDLAIGVIVSGLIYAPLCLFEIRVSPQLHTWVYGYFPHVSFFQTMRYGGFRPTVFMEHGLAVGAWMCTVALTAFWLWRCRAFPQFRLWALRAPPILIASGLFFVLVLSKSFGAIGLGLAGALALLCCSWSRLRIFALILLLMPLFYVYGRAVGGWSGKGFAEAVGDNISRERAASFYFRLENENVLINKALERPLLGWGGWGRARVYDEEGNDLTTTDGLWIIVLGNQGALGLVALGIAIGLPAALVFFAFPVKVWARPQFAPAIVLAMTLVLYLIDGLANAMINPVFMLIAGGLNSLSISPVRQVLRTNVDALALDDVGQSGPVTFRAQPGIGVRAVAKYGPGPLADADLRAPNDCGVDHTCPAL